MRRYDFKPAEEFGWAALVAAVVASLQIVESSDPATVTDWRAGAIALAAAAVRAAAGGMLARLEYRRASAADR